MPLAPHPDRFYKPSSAMPLPDKPILVTGGAGLIGSNLITALNAMGREDIIVVDILGSDQRWKNLVPLRFVDYLEAGQLPAHLESDRLCDIGTIFHLGACSATTETDCSYLIRNNYEFTRALAEWAIHGNRRFVYASSAATYGDGSAGMEDGESNLERYRPLNMYGYSKHLFDLHARSRGWLSQIVGLKYFNVFGPGEDHKGDMRSVVHKAYAQIREKGSVQLFKSEHPDYPDGGQKRDFFYVKDAVQATIHLAATPGAAGLFNLGSGQASTWLELVTPIFGALGLPVNIEFIDLPAPLRGKYQYYTCADTSRLRSTGWAGPTHSLDSAVRDYVSNHLLRSS
jgi:ADP-L-glycero-D-manno-heptose 6-epimerase